MNPKLLPVLALVWAGGFAGHLQAETARETLLRAAQTARQQTAEHPHPFRDLKIFDVASSNTVAGAGFLVADENTVVAVTAKHPFTEAGPTDIIRANNQFRLQPKIHDADDILAFTVAVTNVPVLQLMPAKSRLLRAGDTLSVIGHEGVLTGKLTRAGLGQDEMLLPGQPVTGTLQLMIPGAHDLAGNSGAPVILDETGEVIGVLLGAEEFDRETAVDFQLLSLDPPERHPAFVPPTIFSIKTGDQPAARTADFSEAILPPEIFALSPGMPITTILEQRPFLPNRPTPWLHGNNYDEAFASDRLFRSVTFTVSGGQAVKFEFMNGGPDPTPGQVESLFDWFFATLGKPPEAFLFGEHRHQPGYASIYCQWTNSQATVILGASSSGSKHIYLELLAFVSGTPPVTILQPSWKTPISSDLGFLRGEVQKLARKSATQTQP